MPKVIRVHTIRHEQFERWEMKRLIKKGYSKRHAYLVAHKFALAYEKREIPFPKKNVKQNLERLGVKYQ
jgi:hypothetical protein